MLQALRIRDFRLLWIGSIVSDLGSWLLILAIPAHVFLATGSLRDTGLTLAAQYLPLLLLGPVAGVFTDRWDRRRLMIGTNLFRAGAVAAMLLGISPGRYWVLYIALIAESSGGVLYWPGYARSDACHCWHGYPAEQRQLTQRLCRRGRPAPRRYHRRRSPDRLRHQMADLR